MPCFQSAIEKYNSSLDESRSRADVLDAEIMTISEDIDELQDKVWSLWIPARTANKDKKESSANTKIFFRSRVIHGQKDEALKKRL